MAKRKTIKILKEEAAKHLPKEPIQYSVAAEGRPPKYDVILNNLEQLYVLAARGFTEQEMSDFFGITRSTFQEYKKKFPEFNLLLGQAKMEADSLVIKALYQRCLGFTTTEKTVRTTEKGIEVSETTKEVIPDTMALKFWLSHRRGWQETTGIDFLNIEKKVEDMTIEEREQRLIELKKKIGEIEYR